MVRSKRLGKVTELTVVTPIQTGCVEERIPREPGGRVHRELRTYRQRLEMILRSLQQRIEAGIPTPAQRLGTIHFARWFILDDPRHSATDAPGVHPGSLVFTSNFDGDARLYLRDFSTQIPDDMDAVWSCCEGYPPQGCRDFEAFWKYAQQHQVETLAFIAAHPQHTVADIDLAFGSAR